MRRSKFQDLFHSFWVFRISTVHSNVNIDQINKPCTYSCSAGQNLSEWIVCFYFLRYIDFFRFWIVYNNVNIDQMNKPCTYSSSAGKTSIRIESLFLILRHFDFLLFFQPSFRIEDMDRKRWIAIPYKAMSWRATYVNLKKIA